MLKSVHCAKTYLRTYPEAIFSIMTKIEMAKDIHLEL
jgi:hypothetical protein